MLSIRNQLLPLFAVALVGAVAAPAQASETTAEFSSSSIKPAYFSATLLGRNEIAVPGGPAVGEPKGSADAEVEIEGSRVTFAFSWKGIPAPTMGHIHLGAAGVNGDVKIPLFTSALPATSNGAAGVVTVDDATLVTSILANPSDFYLNLHTTAFPAGAVRGQLIRSRHGRSPLTLLHRLPLQTLMNGTQEVPVAGGPAVGDPDGQGMGMIRASGHRISYDLSWSGLGQPTMGHIHLGAAGVSGPVVVPLFTGDVPEHIFEIAGLVPKLDKSLVTKIRNSPTSYYVNVHSAEFPGGAIRGQLYPAGHIGG